MRIHLVAIGSRGDVQPLIALAVHLQAGGHAVCLISGDDFQAQSQQYGVPFQSIGVCLQETILAHTNIFQLAAQLAPRILAAVQGLPLPDAIVATFLGVCTCDQARTWNIPFFYAVPIPGLPTRQFAYPALPERFRWKWGGAFNWLTHKLMEKLVLASYPAARSLFVEPRPTYLHFFSQHLVPRPPEWGSYAHVTGFWFLDCPPDWQPPDGLLEFIEQGPPPVGVGFGSMTDADSASLTASVTQALARCGQRAVLVSGWGEVGQTDLPGQANLYSLKSVPYDWLFPRLSLAVHHGGAGTTALAVRAGIPSVIVPFGLDQPFWGERVQATGVGPAPIPRRNLSAERLAEAIQEALEDKALHQRCMELGRKIQQEDGLGQAAAIIEKRVGGK